MRNKILKLVLSLSLLFTISLNASETLPDWIKVSYSDLESQSVSEYQLVTVTVTEHKAWWRDQQTNISVDYDPQQLQLVNTLFFDSLERSIPQAGPAVTSDLSNFKVEYQFYLNKYQNLDDVQITINKNDQSQVVNLNTTSYTTDHLIEIGDLKLNTSITNYQNDGTNINYTQHFEVLDNPTKEPFTITLKPNNMNVQGPEVYNVRFATEGAIATTLDKTNYQINAQKGSSFDLIIDSSISGLSAKNNRFEFFVYIESGDDFIRLEPTFFESNITLSGNPSRVIRYTIIKLVIIGFFIILGLIFILNNRKSKVKN